MAEGELNLTVKMSVLARRSGFGEDPQLDESAISHLVTAIGTPQGALWDLGQRWTRNYCETWAVLVPAREVTARSKEQDSSVGPENTMIKTFED